MNLRCIPRLPNPSLWSRQTPRSHQPVPIRARVFKLPTTVPLKAPCRPQIHLLRPPVLRQCLEPKSPGGSLLHGKNETSPTRGLQFQQTLSSPLRICLQQGLKIRGAFPHPESAFYPFRNPNEGIFLSDVENLTFKQSMLLSNLICFSVIFPYLFLSSETLVVCSIITVLHSVLHYYCRPFFFFVP